MSGKRIRPLEQGPLGYSVRFSDRARQVRLVMRACGLEVVVPRGYSREGIEALLDRRRGWIERSWNRLEEERRRLESDPPRLPAVITLPAVGEKWMVDYRRSSARDASSSGRASAVAREASGHRLRVTGDPTGFETCRDALLRWLGRRGRRELVPRLSEIALRHGFHYEKVFVRQQRTRWGSCSSRRSISLNARLLLMPSEAVDYVILHELCHTVRMDHSREFWSLVGSHDPEYGAHRRLVRDAAKVMPTWLDQVPDEDHM